MNQFESRFQKMKTQTQTQTPIENPKIDSLNKDITLFQDELTQNINIQYKKEWKKLSKDCKIRILFKYCGNNNITNFDYLKKYINKLEIEYNLETMTIININNIIKIENETNSTYELQIKDLKIKNSKKKSNFEIDTELDEDI
jgi:hypothetical protein